MRAALRTALFCSISAASTTSFRRPLLRNLSLSLPLLPLTPHPCRLSEAAGPPPSMANTPPLDASATAASRNVDSAGGVESLLYVSSSMDRQFEDFRAQMEESGNIRERIRAVAAEMEAALRVMHSYLLLVHQSLPVSEVLKKAKAQIEVLKDLYGRLAEILRGCPGQYYRYHGDWRSETQSAVSLLTFSRWLESGCLMTHSEVENELGCLSAVNDSEFGLDIEDYLTGLCFMSNELPRYVVNQVTAGDYDCPRKVLKFLTELHSAFRMLNLRNDFLRKKFDGMKYDLRRVEEVYYDVKIRGLSQSESTPEQNA